MEDEKKAKSELISELEELRERVESLQAVLDSTSEGILAVDEKGRIIFTNKLFAKMWRIPPDLIEASDDDELLAFVLDELNEPEAFLSRIRDLYESFQDSLDTLSFRDGRVFERYSQPLVRQNKLDGRVWSFRDVSGRARAESG